MSTTQAENTQEDDYSQSEDERYDTDDDEEEWDTESMNSDDNMDGNNTDSMEDEDGIEDGAMGHFFEDIMQRSEFASEFSTTFGQPFSLTGFITADVRARTQRIVDILRDSTDADDSRRMALLNEAFSNHLHSAEFVALLVDLFGECDRLDMKMAICKLLHHILTFTSVTISSEYLEVLDTRGLFELLSSQLTSIEYVDLAEAALPIIAVLCERVPKRAAIFIDCLMAIVDFVSLSLQRLVYRSLSFVGDENVLSMMQAAVLGDDGEMIDSALKMLTRLHALVLLRDRLYELAMQRDLIPSTIDALLSLSSDSDSPLNPQVMIALLRNGHLDEFMRLMDATGRCSPEVESELIRYIREVPTISDRRTVFRVLERCFSTAIATLGEGSSSSTLDLERAELVASLFEHREDVRRLTVYVSSEALLLNGLERTDDGLLHHHVLSMSFSMDRVQTGWQLLHSLDTQNGPPSMTEEARLIGVAHRALFRYDSYAKLVQLHQSLDHLLPFAHPVRMFACIRALGGETRFRESSTSVDLLMSAKELVNVLVSKWKRTPVNPRPPFILISADYSDVVLGNEGCILSPETDSFELHLIHKKNPRIVVGDTESLAAALARSLFPTEPWKHNLEVVQLAASYSIELLPKSSNPCPTDQQQPTRLLTEGPLYTLLQWLKQRHAKSLLPSEAFVNARLDAKLAAQLREAPMAALGTYPPHWSSLVTEYPFLFSFETKKLYMRVMHFGSIRALHAIGAEGKTTRLLRIPRVHLQVNRSVIAAAIQRIARIPRDSLMEIQYDDEIGTGPGPTLEFYTIASRHLANDEQLWSHQGRYPKPRADMTRLALFCERALLDERTIDVDLHEAFFSKLAGASDAHALCLLDPQLHSLLYERAQELIGQPYELPGYPDIKLSQEHTVITEETLSTYVRDVTEALTDCSSFTAASTAIPIHLYRTFTPSDLRRLLYGSSHDSTQWTVPVFLASINADHGYSVASPQIRWLAKYVCSLSEKLREAFLQWCTGASRLPEGGWAAFKPSLTIVPKTPASAATGSATKKNGEPVAEELPSVMTCVNYLKLPRYSTEEVLRRKMETAIIEGGDSFHLS